MLAVESWVWGLFSGIIAGSIGGVVYYLLKLWRAFKTFSRGAKEATAGLNRAMETVNDELRQVSQGLGRVEDGLGRIRGRGPRT
jgi:hypothetical protein